MGKKNYNKSYFAERIYSNEYLKKEPKIVQYWKRILGDDVIDLIKDAYGVSLDSILFSKYNINSLYNSFSVLENEYLDMWNEEPKAYITKSGEKILFDRYVLRFIGYGKKVLIRKSKQGYMAKEIQDCFLKNLAEKILDVSLSTLIFEMYLLKTQQELKGIDEKEEYEDYNKRFLGNAEYVKELFSIYPGLERMVIQLIENLTNNYVLLQERLVNDNSLLVNEFGKQKGLEDLKCVDLSGSDSHRKGNSVFLIEFNDGKKVVYKPHGLKIEKVYQSFLEFVSKYCKISFRQFLVIDRGDYGWEEYIINRPCNNKNEIKNYYYRIGMLIFCNYILNVNDIHTENLIANGEYPVIVDAETVLDNKKDKAKKTGREKIYDSIHDSVLYSGILPFYKYSQNGEGINMSALNGKEGDEYPLLIPRLKEVGTSNMHYEYERPITQASKNLLKLGGEIQDPGNYLDEISEGFFDAYTFFMNNKSILLDYVQVFENIEVRHLVQDTQRYSMLLHTSYNPDFLQDAKDRQLFLCSILKNVEQVQGDIRIAKLEIKDMLNMDVPYFYSNTSEKDIYGSEGEKIKNYYSESSMQHLKNKIGCMDSKDRDSQIRLMKIVLTNLNDLKVEKPKKNMKELYANKFKGEQNRYKKRAIKKILHTLEDKAFYGDSGEDINWMGVTSIGSSENSSWNIQPLGVYLYEGLGGIAIFYNALQQTEDGINLSKACKAFDNVMFQYTNDMLERTENLENESSGAFVGEASVIYVYQVLYRITGKQKYLEYAEKHCKVLEYTLTGDKNNDVVYGNAGAVIVLLNMYNLTQKEKYLHMACEAGDILIQNQNKGKWSCGNGQILSGFSHGVAGILYALAKLNSVQATSIYRKAIHSGLIFENTMYIDEYENWLDNREEALKQKEMRDKFMAAWCHGAPGILLARSKMYNLMDSNSDREIILRDINNAVHATEKYGFTDNDCLCHGNLGNTEILLEYAKECGDEEVRNNILVARTHIASNIINDNYDCARAYLYGYKIPGFMTGIAGMGYSLLRDIHPELPCVLALEI